jgi:two-component system LytT family sensor kinase
VPGSSAENRYGDRGVNATLAILWVPFWLLMLLISVEDHRGDPGILWWEPVLWEGSSAVIASVLLALQRRLTAGWPLSPPWRWFARHFAWLPLVALAFIPLVFSLRHGVYALAGETYEHRAWLHLLFYEGIKLLLFAGLWLGIIFGLESFASWRQERERLLVLQKHLAEAQLAQLRAQLQPHFLFNALNTISSIMQVDVERADRLLTLLADLLRASLGTATRPLSSLREELDLLALYARVMQERFAGRVTLQWQVQDETLAAAIPSMLLQPLLENAYKHGVERSATPVSVHIDARRDGERLVVTLRNTGQLAPLAGSTGIGLRNCQERLAVLHGADASLTLTEEGPDVCARLTLPWQRYAA